MAGFLHALLSDLRKEHRLPKLLISGAGEVTMVMLGVLLALGVQNWNDDRKDAIKETKLLREMRENLNGGPVRLPVEHRLQRTCTTGEQDRIAAIGPSHSLHPTPCAYTLPRCSAARRLVANTSAYDNLKSIGFHLIRTDSLRKAITVLYSEALHLPAQHGTRHGRTTANRSHGFADRGQIGRGQHVE
jgi:hypothetical protein